MSDLVNVSGLWRRESKSGKTYYSAFVKPEDLRALVEQLETATEGVYLQVWNNTNKKTENSPDLSLTLSYPEGTQASRPVDDDIPF